MFYLKHSRGSENGGKNVIRLLLEICLVNVYIGDKCGWCRASDVIINGKATLMANIVVAAEGVNF